MKRRSIKRFYVALSVDFGHIIFFLSFYIFHSAKIFDKPSTRDYNKADGNKWVKGWKMIQDRSTKNEKNTRSYKKLYRFIVEVSGTSKEGILFRQSPKNVKSIEEKTSS